MSRAKYTNMFLTVFLSHVQNLCAANAPLVCSIIFFDFDLPCRRKPLTTLSKKYRKRLQPCIGQWWSFLPRCMECRRGLAMRILSVRLSVTGVDCDKTVERFVQIYIPYKRTFSLVFWEVEWLVGATPSTWNFGSTGPRWGKIADFEPIIARSASAVTPSEKSSINANRKSSTRFPMSLRWSSYVAPKSPKGMSKTAISVRKSYFAWTKSATKFLRVKTVSGKVVRHSLA